MKLSIWEPQLKEKERLYEYKLSINILYKYLHFCKDLSNFKYRTIYKYKYLEQHWEIIYFSDCDTDYKRQYSEQLPSIVL